MRLATLSPMTILRTERLLLRRWREADLEPFHRLNNDPRVLDFLPGPLDRGQCEAWVERMEAGFDELGFGLWAVEVEAGPAPKDFIGFVGLEVPRLDAHFTPCIEVGWRLDADSWGNGYATEAARAALAHGLGPAGLEEVVSFTVTDNLRSRAVMERIGMTHDPADDFDHPRIPKGHRLERHVLYRARRPEAGRLESREA